MNVLIPTGGALLACIALVALGTDTTASSGRPSADARGDRDVVALSGCVVDTSGRPAALAVQARYDGGVAATTVSGHDGHFRLVVPSHSVLRIEALGGQAHGITVMTGSSALALTGCLRSLA